MQLLDFNKAVAHNAFAVPPTLPTPTSTVGILDWTCKEIDQIDIKTRKTLAISGILMGHTLAEKMAGKVSELKEQCTKAE